VLGRRCTGKANSTPSDLHMPHAPLPTMCIMRHDDAKAEKLAWNESLQVRRFRLVGSVGGIASSLSQTLFPDKLTFQGFD